MLNMKDLITTLILALLTMGTLSAQVNDRFEEKRKSAPADTSSTEVPAKAPAEQVVKSSGKEVKPDNIWDKMVFGGDLSLSFGSYTAVYVAPTVGYRFSDKLVAGPGFIYQYFRWNQVYDPFTNSLRNVDDYGNEIYGPKLFVNYALAESIYLGSQFEYLNHDYYTYQGGAPPNKENRWTSVLFLEAGLRSSIGQKGFAVVGLRYNLLHDFTSPYSSAWFPVIGFFF